jgi:hypothetical protein
MMAFTDGGAKAETLRQGHKYAAASRIAVSSANKCDALS